MIHELRTDRLLLRAWRDEDLEPFASLNGDAEAMRFYPHPYTREESDGAAHRIAATLCERGWGLWAVEAPGVAPFVGCIGLAVPMHDLPFMPCVEVGWRLSRAFFGRGYATEAARASLAFGFKKLALREIVAMTAFQNSPSQAVMERLRMHCDPADDFDHPGAAGTHVERHVLYRIGREEMP